MIGKDFCHTKKYGIISYVILLLGGMSKLFFGKINVIMTLRGGGGGGGGVWGGVGGVAYGANFFVCVLLSFH